MAYGNDIADILPLLLLILQLLLLILHLFRLIAVYINIIIISLQVIKVASMEGIARGPAVEHLANGERELKKWITANMFVPRYTSLVYLPRGVKE